MFPVRGFSSTFNVISVSELKYLRLEFAELPVELCRFDTILQADCEALPTALSENRKYRISRYTCLPLVLRARKKA